MTRRRMLNQIKERLEEQNLPVNEDTRAVADAAVDGALEYVLEYAMNLSAELLADPRNYDKAMATGTVISKIKRLLGE